MRRDLKQFLSDKRVVEAKGPLWWLIFNGIILTKRPKKSARAYHSIWNHALDESPLKTITRNQSTLLEAALGNTPDLVVDWAMRYGNPSIPDVLGRMALKCDRILIFPLYPQYSAATTATVMDTVFDTLKTMRKQPAIRAVAPYYNHPAYIDAIANSIREHHAGLPQPPDATIASLHGLPVNFIEKGDPYRDHCETTADLLRHATGMTDSQLLLTYQSRSGRAVWLSPDTEETLVRLAQDGHKNLSIIAPGFASDCVETLEELSIRAVKKFRDAGGETCSVIPCLNDSKQGIHLLDTLARENLQGWI
jgi:ferrochelatase